MITLILTRHGETDWNAAGKVAGSSNMPKLTLKAKSETAVLAHKLKNFNIDVIYSSKLRRAVDTARIIASHLKKDVKTLVALNERSLGIYEGRNKIKVFRMLDKMTLEKRFWYRPRGGESWLQFEERLDKVFKTIIENHQNKTVLVVSHAGVMKAIVPVLQSADRQKSLEYNFANSSFTLLKIDEGKVVEELINDISHLESI